MSPRRFATSVRSSRRALRSAIQTAANARASRVSASAKNHCRVRAASRGAAGGAGEAASCSVSAMGTENSQKARVVETIVAGRERALDDRSCCVAVTRVRASSVILSRICNALLATPDGAARSCRPMIFLIAIVLIIVVALAAYAGYSIGVRNGVRGAVPAQPYAPASAPALAAPTAAPPASADESMELERIGLEKARIIRSRDAEAAALRRSLADRDAHPADDEGAKRDREQLNAELADAHAESARYRRLVIDIENNAPPPILAGAGEPDDLKLIVGIGPVLERMLHNLGVTTFRQIARWSERDSAEFDARLPEFTGRIVRDQWVTQARELHLAKFGELPSDRRT